MGSETGASQVPKIDFSGLDPANPGSQIWSQIRTQVADALTSTGCFEAVYPKSTQDLRNSLFNSALIELFSLPLETKIKNDSDKPFHAYVGTKIPNEFLGEIAAGQPTYESLAILDAPFLDAVQSFTNLMWPHGNPNFCGTVHSFAEQLAGLDQMVVRMVMESLGAERFYETNMLGSMKYLFRMSEYGAPEATEEEEEKMGLKAHTDTNVLAVISQNQVDGLEIETRDGDWIPVVPSDPHSLIIVAGDALRAWSNGRVHSPLHRVVVRGDGTRYSTILFSFPAEGTVIQAPPELVDSDHPARFGPYDYMSYLRFCLTEEGLKANPRLEAFCGLVNQ